MVERLTAQACRVNADLQIFFRFFLPGIILQQPRAQRTLTGILRKYSGRSNDLLLGVLGKLMLIYAPSPAYCCIMARNAALMI